MTAKAKPYDEGAEFRVKLMREVNYRGAVLAPLPWHEMPGRTLNAIVAQEGSDVVDLAEPR